MADETRLHFDITGDNQSLISSLREAQKAMANVVDQMENGGKQVTSEMDSMANGIESTFKRIAQAAGGVFAVSKAKEMISEIIDVRKEFQSLELSFATLTGDAAKGKKLFADITQFATTTPMLEKDLAKGAQTLLGFNIEAEKVMPILKQIGDISMGDSQKFESLTLAFAQASSTGKLMGQDLLQMINAGFNPLVEISRTTGKSISELKDDMSAGKISVEMLQNAFKTATEEGGKFHGMLNGMANGMQGAFSNLEGAMQKLFNDLGQEIEGPIVEGANLATASLNGLAANLDTVGHILEGLVATCGAYKAASLAAAAVETARAAGIGALTTAEQAHYAWLILTQKAQAMLNATMAINPYVAAATAIAAVAAALYVFADRATGAEQAQQSLNDAIAEQKQKEGERNAAVQKAISLATDESKASSERAQGIQALVAEYGPIIQKYIDEEGHLTNIIALKKELALLDGKKSVSELQGQSKQYAEYARLAKLALQGRGSMSKADNAALDKAMAVYNGKTGGGKYDYSRAASYFSSMAKGTGKQAGTAATQANVNSFSEGIGAMTSKQLQTWQKRLQMAQKLAKSGSLVNIQGITKGATADQIESMLTQINGTLTARNKKPEDAKKKTTKGDGKSVANELQKEAAKREKLQQELTALERKNQEAENDTLEEGLDKKLAILKSAHEEEIEELQKQATDWARENKKAKMKGTTATATIGGVQTSGLTAGQAAALQSGQDVSDRAYDKAVKDARKQLVQSQIDYLKGAKNIYDQHEGNLMDLQNQRSQIDPNDTYALMANDRAVEEENTRFADQVVLLRTGVDELWRNFETLSAQALEKLEAQLKDAVENGVDGKKVSQELARELQLKLKDIKLQLQTGGSTGGAFGDGKFFGRGGMAGNSWIGKVGQSLKKVNDAQAKYQADKAQWEQDKSALAEAQKQQADLQNQYIEAKDAGDAKQAAQIQQQLAQAQQATQAAQAASASSGAQASSSASAASGSSGAAAFAITDAIIHGVNQNIQSFQQAAKYLWDEDSDMYKSVSKFAESSQHATDGFDSFKNGDFMGTALNVGEAVNDLGEAFGLWSNSNYDDWADTNEKLINSQNTLTAAINSLADDMKDQTAGQAYSTKEQMLSYAEQQMQAAQQTLDNNAGLHEGGHSLWYDFDEDTNGRSVVSQMFDYLYKKTGNEEYANRGDAIGIGDIAKLDARDAELFLKDQEGVDLLTQFSNAVASASDSGNYGAKGNWYEDWLNYVQTYGSDYFQGIEDSFYETVNGLSFDSFKENFVSMMMDLSSEVDDFADSFNEQLTQSIMTDTVNDLYKDDLEKLYQDWGDLMTKRTGDDALSDEEFYKQVEELQQRETDLSSKIISTRDEIAAATGYDDNESQKATRSSIENITQDQADQLIGRITAIQIAVEASNAATATQAQNTLNSYNVLMSMNNSMSLANNSLSDILLQHVQSNSYLADIVKTQRSIYEELEGRIEKMSNKLETL